HTEEHQQKLNSYYENEGLCKGTVHSIKDDFKRPWKHAKHSEHTAAKLFLYPYAAIDTPLRFFGLPISAPVSAGLLYLSHKNVQSNERAREEEIREATRPKM